MTRVIFIKYFVYFSISQWSLSNYACFGGKKISTSVGMQSKVWYQNEKYTFIALIHPIQWTIAYPVGADRPAKRQKKTSCVSTGQAGPVLCTRQVACSTSFLSRQRDVIASFSFGACLCARNIFIRSLSSDFHCYW